MRALGVGSAIFVLHQFWHGGVVDAVRHAISVEENLALQTEGNNVVVSDTSSNSSRGKQSCQYTARVGRPKEVKKGMLSKVDWHDLTEHIPDVDFRYCMARCDKDANCIAFVRRAGDDVGYLSSAAATLIAARDDPTKMLAVPSDVQLGDCWLLMAAKLTDSADHFEIIKKRKLTGTREEPFRRLALEQKASFRAQKEKVTYEKRDCGCEYRYLGHRYPLDGAPVTSTLATCEGEFRFLGKEWPEYGVESVYQRTDGQKFLYICTTGVPGQVTLARHWYCMDKDDPRIIAEKAQNASWFDKAGFGLLGASLMKFQTCLGQPLNLASGSIGQSDLALSHAGKAVSFPRHEPIVLSSLLQTLEVPVGQAMLTCANDKKDAADIKKQFYLSTSQCQKEVIEGRIETARWFNEKGAAQKFIVGSLAVSLRTVFSGIFFHRERSYTDIIWRSLELWEKLEKAMALIDYIQEGKTVSGTPMTEGEKYACAEEMVEQVKTAGGIMPKVAQTLAMKPDVVKDDFVRAALKTTQTENPAKDLEIVKEYIQSKEQEAMENDDRVNGDVVEDVLDLLEVGQTLATGSVAQVMKARVKNTARPEHRLLCGDKQGCEVVLKVVFDTNEKNYEDDWTAIQFLGDSLLKAVLSLVSSSIVGNTLLIMGMNSEKLDKIKIGVSAGYDTWQALRQGMGAIMDEFDLRVEDANAKKGQAIIEAFDADIALKRTLGIEDISFRVPKVLMTRSRYVMIQSMAKGNTLTSHHAAITGQADKLKEWRTQIYPAIIGLYGHLIVEKGFFQGDPHPGNWFWESSSKGGILTLIDWGLADDFSAGLGRAGQVYVDAKGRVPKVDGEDLTQEGLESIIFENQCKIAKFYKDMGEFRRKELVCNGVEATSSKLEPSTQTFVPSAGPSWILDGSELHFLTKYHGIKMSGAEAISSDAFFGPPDLGRGSQKPFVLQRQRQLVCEGSDNCGYGWELDTVDGTGSRVFTPVEACTSGECLLSNLPDVKVCKQSCKDAACFSECEKLVSDVPSRIGTLQIQTLSSLPQCRDLPTRDEAYTEGAATLGYKTATMNPVVLSLFAALHTNDLLDLKARQENIQVNDPKEEGVELPAYSSVLLRCLQVFLGMIQDMVAENRPPFVPTMISEFIMDTGPDEMFTYWYIFAQRFLETQGSSCPA